MSVRNFDKNPHLPYTPEWRVWNLAQLPGTQATPVLVLMSADWVPNDGTDLRDELLAQYANDYANAYCRNCTDPGNGIHSVDCPDNPRYQAYCP
jgi:hypothetical protein